MVYRGKPSKACQPCRKRKLVCDLRPEGCSACRRAKIECSGYRDTEGLRVKDESALVRRRAQDKHSRQQQQQQPYTAIGPVIDLDLCHQARDIFYYNYVVGPSKSYDFLLPYYKATRDDHHLVTSLDAVSLAYLNYQKRSPSAQDEARRKYVKALQQTGEALQNKHLAMQNSTLLAILLLDLYEKITHKGPRAGDAWVTHLNGALSLVKLRGAKQFQDPASLRMLIRLSTNLLISAVAGAADILPGLLELRQKVSSILSGPGDPKWRESGLMLEYAEFKYRRKQGLVDDDEILAKAVYLDAGFAELSRNVESGWQYRVVTVEGRSSHHFENYHHEYPAEHIAQMWNVLRLTRILLNQVIHEYSARKMAAQAEDRELLLSPQEKSASTIRSLGSDICASVPQFIGDVADPPFSKIPATKSFASRLQRSRLADATQHLPCYRLIYPLYIAALSRLSLPSLTQYAIEQLRFMAEYHAIENAAKVADILESGEKREPWDVYVLLGSYAFVC